VLPLPLARGDDADVRTIHVAAAFVAALMLGACSSDEPSARDNVCDTRAELSDQIDDVRTSLGEGDLEATRTAIMEIPGTVEELRSLSDDLSAEVRADVQPQLDSLQAAVAGLGDVDNLTDLGDQLSTIMAELDATVDQIRVGLNCK
jgi:hypothetical protein